MDLHFRCLHFRRVSIIGMILLLWVSLLACQPQSGPGDGATPTLDLAPYHTFTPTRTTLPPTPAGTATPTSPPPTVPPPPTATPFLHTIIEGDTFLGIALRYGVTVEDIQAANPEVNPNLLVVGTQVIIPIPLDGDDPSGTPQSAATPTPVAVELADPVCYLQSDGGVWCLALAGNESGRTLENVSGWMSLLPATGEVLGKAAIAPLNILPSGGVLPLAAYFSPPVPQNFRPIFTLLAALPLAEGDSRYAQTELTIESVEILTGGLEALVTGNVFFPLPLPTATPTGDPARLTETPTVTPSVTPVLTGTPSVEGPAPAARLVWLALVAYDANDQVIGFRKWEVPVEVPFGGYLPFEVSVFSLGPLIDRVDVLVEARP